MGMLNQAVRSVIMEMQEKASIATIGTQTEWPGHMQQLCSWCFDLVYTKAGEYATKGHNDLAHGMMREVVMEATKVKYSARVTQIWQRSAPLSLLMTPTSDGFGRKAT